MASGRLVCRIRSFNQHLSCTSKRWLSTHVTPLSEPLEQDPTPKPSTRIPPGSAKVTKLPSGLAVVSLENCAPVSTVSVFIRAGSRFEPVEKQGVTHLLRTCGYQSTKDRSALRISREVEQVGGTLNATTTREHQVYGTTVMRDDLDVAMDTLQSVLSDVEFKRWEVNDQKPRVALDLAVAQAQTNTVLMEELHKTAFRDQLSNSIFCPSHNLPKLTHEDLNEFTKTCFVAKRMTLVGIGVDHEELVKEATASFGTLPVGEAVTTTQADFVGGGEVRLSTGSAVTHAVLACQGASLGGSPKESLTAGVLQHVLGGSSFVKWGDMASRLGKAVSAACDGPSAVNSFNIGYSDNGLFGVYAISEGKNMDPVLRTIVKEFKNVALSLSDQDLSRAKNQLKAAILMGSEQRETLLNDMALQVSLRGSYTSPEDAAALIDSITAQEVTTFARKILNTRAVLCCHGDVSSVPRLDALLAELK